MTRLTTPKALILEMVVNDTRNTVDLIEQIARILGIAIGEREHHEYVKLMHIRTIKQRETA